MQLAVLSVLQLPTQPKGGQYVLQGTSDDAQQVLERQKGCGCLPSCGLLSGSRAARYAAKGDSSSVCFTLTRQAAPRATTWVLQTDGDGLAGAVRVEQLRGAAASQPQLPSPSYWPVDELQAKGLPRSFDCGPSPASGGIASGPGAGGGLSLGVASAHVRITPPPGVAGPRLLLVSHVYWDQSCPGRLVLAEARMRDTDWRQLSGRSGAGAGAQAGREPSGQLQQQPSRANSTGSASGRWRWHVLMLTPGYEYVGPAAGGQHAQGLGAPSPVEGVPGPQPVAAQMAWHPQGHALALSVTDSSGHSCVVVLGAATMQPLWHRRWEPDAGPTPATTPTAAAGPPSVGAPVGARTSSLAWVPGLPLLVVTDDAGNLCVLDSRGDACGAALVCGAIKYGESPLVRLGPILGKAAPLAISSGVGGKGAVVDFPRLHRRQAHSSGGGGRDSEHLPTDQDRGPRDGISAGRTPSPEAPNAYTLAFAAHPAMTSARASGLHTPPALTYGGTPSAANGLVLGAGWPSEGPTQQPRTPSPSSHLPLLAVCNGAAVALLRITLRPDPDAAAAIHLHDYGAHSSPFKSLTLASMLLPDHASSSSRAQGVEGSPDHDAVPSLPPGGSSLRVDLALDHASSFASSAVSTPYMLGLQRPSHSSILGGPNPPLLTCRSNVSDAMPQPGWPLLWRSVLSLPMPGHTAGPHLHHAGSAFHSHGGHQGGHYHPSGMLQHAPSSVAPSSVFGGGGGRPDASVAGASNACPSPTASAAYQRLPSGCMATDQTGVAMAARKETELGPSTVAAAAAGAGAGAGVAAGASGKAAAGGELAQALVCSSPGALRALQQGDVLVLRGGVADALQHYPRAHVYGFLPAFLALVHLHRVDAAARLLRAYAAFTGHVAVAAAAAAAAASPAAPSASTPAPAPSDAPSQHTHTTTSTTAHSPTGSCSYPSAATLQRRWQASMHHVLDTAFRDHALTEKAATATGMIQPPAAPGGAYSGTSGGATGAHKPGGVPLPPLPVQRAGEAARPSSQPAPTAHYGNGNVHSGQGVVSPELVLRLPLEKFRNHQGEAAAAAARTHAHAQGHVPHGGVASGGDVTAVEVATTPVDSPGLQDRLLRAHVGGGQHVSGPGQLQPPQQEGGGGAGVQDGRGSGGSMAAVPENEELDLGEEGLTDVGHLGRPHSLHQQRVAHEPQQEHTQGWEQDLVWGGAHLSAQRLRPLSGPAAQLGSGDGLLQQASADELGHGHGTKAVDLTRGSAAVPADGCDEPPLCDEEPGGGPGVPASHAEAAEALREMLCACLQLLQLACQAMAFVAYSAHGVGRAAAAAAAVEAVAPMPMSPSSPRSPAGGVLSRQAMRRLSSTIRMRSIKARSTSMFGGHNSLSGGGATAPAAATVPGAVGVASGRLGAPGSGSAAAGGAAGTHPGAPSPLRFGSAVSVRAASMANGVSPAAATLGNIAGGTAVALEADPAPSTGLAAAPLPPVVVGFPIPVVWQPLPGNAHTSPHAPGQLSTRLAASSVASSAAHRDIHHTQPHMHGPHPSHVPHTLPNDGLLVLGHHSTADSTLSSPHCLQPRPMRLELHHCAFDVTQLWQDATLQGVGPGQSAASLYLRPSYAAGLLLMAHACGVQLEQARSHQLIHSTHARGHSHNSSDMGPGSFARHPGSAAVPGGDGGGGVGDGTGAGAVPAAAAHQHEGLSSQRNSGGRQKQLMMDGSNMLRAAARTAAARVNWQLLRQAAAATHGATVWQQQADWQRAALLAFACANALSELGGGSADLPVEVADKKRRKSTLGGVHAAADGGGKGPDGAAGGGGDAGKGTQAGLVSARAACLRMGQQVLLSQVGACQKMEVQDACGALLELVALPRRVLGLASNVHVSLLQKVATRIVDLLPKRVCITPLLPGSSVPPALQLSHAGVRQQLVAHTGAAMARVLEELRLAAACSGVCVSLKDTMQQVVEHSTVDSCVRMLLRWQGAYDGARVDAAACRLPDCMSDMLLMSDTPDWAPDALLPLLQEPLVSSGLLTASDASGVIKAALAAAALGDAASMAVAPGFPARRSEAAGARAVAAAGGVAPKGPSAFSVANSPAVGAGPSAGQSVDGRGGGGLQDLDELALTLDLYQLQQTLLATLQPFLHAAVPLLRRRPFPGSASANATSSAAHAHAPATTPTLGSGTSTAIASAVASPAGAPPSPPNLNSSIAATETATTPAATPTPGSTPAAGVASAAGAAGSGVEVQVEVEDEEEDAAVVAMLEDPGSVGGLPPVELAVACLRLLLKLQWALHCRAQVCAHMLRLVQLQAPPPPPPPSPRPEPADPATGPLATTPSGAAPSSSSNNPLPASPRSITFSGGGAASGGHRSFREYITHQMASFSGHRSPRNMAAAAAAAVAEVEAEEAAAASSAATRKLQDADGSSSRRGPVLADAHFGAAAEGQLPGTGVGARAGAGAAGAAAAMVCSEEMCAVQDALMAWTSALVRADVFHNGSELQGCVLTVLPLIRGGCPGELAGALDRALRRRGLFNARLAEHINRLKREAPTHPPAAPTPTPSCTPGAAPTPSAHGVPVADGTGAPPQERPQGTAPSPFQPAAAAGPGRPPVTRVGSAVRGGVLAPAPSLALGDGSSAAPQQQLPTSHSAQPGAEELPHQPPAALHRPGSFHAPGPSPLGAAPREDAPEPRAASSAVHAPVQRQGVAAGLAGPHAAPKAHTRPVLGLLPPSTPSTPYTPAPPSVTPPDSRLAVQQAVAAAQLDVRATTLRLLGYFADPTGALPSGISSAEAHGTPSTPFAGAGTPSGATSDRPNEASAVQAGRSGGGGGGGPQAAFSRSAQHSTLLQCMVSELVRSSHTVAASVSWRATLEGGRGLAGCFVHPVLHGTGTAPAAALAAGGLPSAWSRHVPGERAAGGGQDAAAGDAAVGRPSDGGAAGVGMCTGAEVSQALLLALLDVRQWATLAVPGASRAHSQAQSAAAADGVPVAGAILPPLPPAPKPAPSVPMHSVFAGGARAKGASPSPDPRAPPADPRDVVLELAEEDEAPEAALPRADPRSTPLREPLGAGSPGLSFRTRAASAGLLLNAGGGDAASGTRTPTTPGARLLSPSPSDMAPRRTGSSATLPGSPGMTTTGRLSISALTDADPDGEQYPYPFASGSASNVLFRGSGTVGGAPGSASTSTGGGVHTGRHTALLFNTGGPGPSGPPMSASMRQHLNPAFGLHSPTPSNLSEFCWDDQASELPSPLSARATPNRQSRLSAAGALATGAAAGGGGSAGMLLRPDDSSPESTAPHGALEDEASGLRASSPAVGLETGGSGEEVGAMLQGLRARTRPENGVLGADPGGEARGGEAEREGAGGKEQQQQLESVFSGSEAATKAAVAAAGGRVGGGSPDAIMEAVERWSSSGLAMAGYERRTPGGGVSLGPGDEMPTLSYMLDVSMLHTIRSAVQQAKSSGGGGGEGGGDRGGTPDGYAGGSGGGGSLAAVRQTVASLGAQQQYHHQDADTVAAARQRGVAEVGAQEQVQRGEGSLVHTSSSAGVSAGHAASADQRQRASDSGGAVTGSGSGSGSGGLHRSSRDSADGAASVSGRTPPLLRDSASETASEVSLSPLGAAGHGSAAGVSGTGSGMSGPMGLPARQPQPYCQPHYQPYPHSSARSSRDGGGRSTSGRQDAWAAMGGGGSAGSGWGPGSPIAADADSPSAHVPRAARDHNPHNPHYNGQHTGASQRSLTGASPGGAASPASSVSFATLPLPTPAVTAVSGGSSPAPPVLGSTPTSHPALLGSIPPSDVASSPLHLFESPVSGLTAAPAPTAASTSHLPHAPALPSPHHDAHSPHTAGRSRHASHSREGPREQEHRSTATANGNAAVSPRPPAEPHQHSSFRSHHTGGASSLPQAPGASHAPATRSLTSPQDTHNDYTFAPAAFTAQPQAGAGSPTTPASAPPRSEPPGRIRAAPDRTPSPSASVARSSIHLADFLRTPTSSSTSPSPVRAPYTPTTAITPTAHTSASHLAPAASATPSLGTTATAVSAAGGTSPAVRRIPRPPDSSTTTAAASPLKGPHTAAGAAPGVSLPHGGIPAGPGVAGGSHAVGAAYGKAASPPGKSHTLAGGGGGYGGYAARRSWEGGASVKRGGDRRVSAEGGAQGGQPVGGSRGGSREASVDGVAGSGGRGSRSGNVKMSPTAGRAVWH